MTKLSISLFQINIQPENFDANFKKASSFLKNIPETPYTKLAILPELWTSGFTPNLEKAAQANNEIIRDLQKQSNRRNIHIMGSYITNQANNVYTNSIVSISPDTEPCEIYQKIHLFPQMNEKKWFVPGKRPAIINFAGLRIALAICYDLRFSSLFQTYAMHDTHLCILPAQWPLKRIDHFRNLSTARAIENQFYFAAVNAVGLIGNTSFGGSSQLIDPHGQSLCTLAQDEEGIITKTIDTSTVKSLRSAFPVLKDQTSSSTAKPDEFLYPSANIEHKPPNQSKSPYEK